MVLSEDIKWEDWPEITEKLPIKINLLDIMKLYANRF